jgi:hypothetical protein
MGILANVGKVEQVFISGCIPKPQVWAKSLVPAGLKLITSLLEPTWKEDIKLLTGKSWLKHLKQFAEESTVESPAAVDGSLNFMFEAAEVLDTIAWYWFLADVGSDFLANWSTLAMKRSPCTPQEAAGSFAGVTGAGTVGSGSGWGMRGAWSETYPTPGIPISPSIDVLPGESWTLCGSQSLAKGFITTGTFQSRIYDVATDEQVEVGTMLDGDGIANGYASMVMASGVGAAGTGSTLQLQVQYDGAPDIGLTGEGYFTANNAGGGGWI